MSCMQSTETFQCEKYLVAYVLKPFIFRILYPAYVASVLSLDATQPVRKVSHQYTPKPASSDTEISQKNDNSLVQSKDNLQYV